MFHILLFEPEIPPNTGNIIRLCANAGAALHLLGPLGFDIDAAAVRRAGLDYADMANVRQHTSLAECLAVLGGPRLFAVETGSTTVYSEARFRPGDALLFGPESRGLSDDVLQGVPVARRVSIPMRSGNRSLNLSNAVSLVLYEAWRQDGFS
ncbi:MAG: tRNA (cytidine(34)-2'-O)-methyltransferase [Steroidobacteraceae bacterium]